MLLKVLQAQTMANFYLAFEQDLTIIPVINKIDMPTADPRTGQLKNLKNYLILMTQEIILLPAKTGIGIARYFGCHYRHAFLLQHGLRLIH